MARRSRRRMSGSEKALWVISLLVVLTMLIGLVATALPEPSTSSGATNNLPPVATQVMPGQ